MLKILFGHGSPSLAKSTLGVALAMGVLTAGQAKAFVVTVNSLQYDVTTFNGTYNANVSKFETAANGGEMPWWGELGGSTAVSFATAVGSQLGCPNPNIGAFGASSCAGPFFGYNNLDINGNRVSFVKFEPGFGISGSQVFFPDSAVWAKASLVNSQAVPGPLPVLGAAAALGFSRKLRKRIKHSTNAVSSTYSL